MWIWKSLPCFYCYKNEIVFLLFLNYFQYISPTLDIEKPEYTSRGFSVLIYKDTHMNGADLVVNVTLPIHLRYHKPSTDFTKFYLYNPELFIRCDRSGEFCFNIFFIEKQIQIWIKTFCFGRSLLIYKKVLCIFED